MSIRSASAERGMVTAETAMVMPVLLALTTALIWMVSLGITEVRCLDAAREAARLAARGDGDLAREITSRVAPDGATITIADSGDLVTVTVSVSARPEMPLLSHLPAITLSAQAVSAAEGTDGLPHS